MRKLLTLILTLLLTTVLSLNVWGAESSAADPIRKPEEETLDPRVEAMLLWALETARDDSHGYSQSQRLGPNYDCTSFVSTALMEGGFPLEGCLSTGGMLQSLPELGFTVYRTGETKPRRGDILIRLGSHAEICMGEGGCVAAHQDYDWRSGDSGGHEIEYRTADSDLGCSFCKYREYNYILRCESSRDETPLPQIQELS